jgi:beta-lactamase class A
MVSRRGMLLGLAGAGLLAGCSREFSQVVGIGQKVAEIVRRHGGRVGVSLTSGTGEENGNFNIQSDQRFAMCSVFKWVLAAAILQAVDQGKLKVAQQISYTKADLLEYAPVTEMHVAKGKMTIGDLCSAAVSLSDNTAANLLLPLIGGPAGLTAFVRALGDTTTRFDRNEPTLNDVTDGDERDTTTPAAMTQLLKTVFTGTVLQPASLSLLKDWMVATTTGKNRIPAGVPAGYVVGHKTGTANTHANDVAVIWPAGGKPPLFLSIFTTGGKLDDAGRDKVIADLTRVIFETLAFVDEVSKKESSSATSS